MAQQMLTKPSAAPTKGKYDMRIPRCAGGSEDSSFSLFNGKDYIRTDAIGTRPQGNQSGIRTMHSTKECRRKFQEKIYFTNFRVQIYEIIFDFAIGA